ncbi:MAG: cytochrome [Phycisphaerales bacterium]|nr:cytochrome [Phycisphaerales bacterium]
MSPSVPTDPPATPSAPAVVPPRTPWGILLTELADAAREHGDVARFRRGWLFTHPDAVRDILVTQDRSFTKSPALRRARFTLGNGLLTNEGPTYRKQRGLIQPSLHPKRLGGYAGVIGRHAAEAAGGWRDGQTIELHREMMRLTLRIVAEALFGSPIGPEVDALSAAMDINVAMFRRMASPWGWLKVLAPTPTNVRFLFAHRRLVGTLRSFVRQRRAEPAGTPHDDLLARLLAARDGDGAGAAPADGGMTERQLIDECVTLFAAGHETTANAMTFTLWLLAQHPAVADRLAAEVDRVVPVGRLPTMDDLDALPYARAVVAESMRLYPPAWIMGRQAKEPVTVAGQPLPKGAVVFVSQWVTHRDARWWPDAERFDPDRFIAEWGQPGENGAGDGRGGDGDTPSRPRWAYFPFGGGSRVCVGEAFAWAEATIALAVIARRWRGEWADPGPMPLDPSITLRPGREIHLTMRRR